MSSLPASELKQRIRDQYSHMRSCRMDIDGGQVIPWNEKERTPCGQNFMIAQVEDSTILPLLEFMEKTFDVCVDTLLGGDRGWEANIITTEEKKKETEEENSKLRVKFSHSSTSEERYARDSHHSGLDLDDGGCFWDLWTHLFEQVLQHHSLGEVLSQHPARGGVIHRFGPNKKSNKKKDDKETAKDDDKDDEDPIKKKVGVLSDHTVCSLFLNQNRTLRQVLNFFSFAPFLMKGSSLTSLSQGWRDDILPTRFVGYAALLADIIIGLGNTEPDYIVEEALHSPASSSLLLSCSEKSSSSTSSPPFEKSSHPSGVQDEEHFFGRTYLSNRKAWEAREYSTTYVKHGSVFVGLLLCQAYGSCLELVQRFGLNKCLWDFGNIDIHLQQQHFGHWWRDGGLEHGNLLHAIAAINPPCFTVPAEQCQYLLSGGEESVQKSCGAAAVGLSNSFLELMDHLVSAESLPMSELLHSTSAILVEEETSGKGNPYGCRTKGLTPALVALNYVRELRLVQSELAPTRHPQMSNPSLNFVKLSQRYMKDAPLFVNKFETRDFERFHSFVDRGDRKYEEREKLRCHPTGAGTKNLWNAASLASRMIYRDFHFPLEEEEVRRYIGCSRGDADSDDGEQQSVTTPRKEKHVDNFFKGCIADDDKQYQMSCALPSLYVQGLMSMPVTAAVAQQLSNNVFSSKSPPLTPHQLLFLSLTPADPSLRGASGSDKLLSLDWKRIMKCGRLKRSGEVGDGDDDDDGSADETTETWSLKLGEKFTTPAAEVNGTPYSIWAMGDVLGSLGNKLMPPDDDDQQNETGQDSSATTNSSGEVVPPTADILLDFWFRACNTSLPEDCFKIVLEYEGCVDEQKHDYSDDEAEEEPDEEEDEGEDEEEDENGNKMANGEKKKEVVVEAVAKLRYIPLQPTSFRELQQEEADWKKLPRGFKFSGNVCGEEDHPLYKPFIRALCLEPGQIKNSEIWQKLTRRDRNDIANWRQSNPHYSYSNEERQVFHPQPRTSRCFAGRYFVPYRVCPHCDMPGFLEYNSYHYEGTNYACAGENEHFGREDFDIEIQPPGCDGRGDGYGRVRSLVNQIGLIWLYQLKVTLTLGFRLQRDNSSSISPINHDVLLEIASYMFPAPIPMRYFWPLVGSSLRVKVCSSSEEFYSENWGLAPTTTVGGEEGIAKGLPKETLKQIFGIGKD